LHAELSTLCKDEDELRRHHDHTKGNLQECWDKLVHLRTHIKLFHSAIEDATIEEATADPLARSTAHSDTQSAADSTSSIGSILLGGSVSRVSDAAAVIREKVRTKESLKSKLSSAELLVLELKQKLSVQTEELTKLINKSAFLDTGSNGDSRVINNGSHVPANTHQTPNHSHKAPHMQTPATNNKHTPNTQAHHDLLTESVTAYLVKRKEILALSQELDAAEESQLKIKAELDFVEKDLSDSLRRAVATHSADGTLASSQFGDSAETSIDALAQSSLLANAQSEFTLHEVLAGKARVQRLNGESAKKYKDRLMKRLVSLTALDLQLQQELDFLAESVRKAKEDVSCVL
jgi:hypothetical protein